MLRSRSGEPAPPPKSFPGTTSPPPHNRSPSASRQHQPHHPGWYPLAARRLPGITAPQPARTSLGNPLHHFENTSVGPNFPLNPLPANHHSPLPPNRSKLFARNRYRQPFTPKRLPQTPSPKTNRSTFPNQGLYTRIMSLNFSNQSPMSRNHHSVTSADFTCPAKPPKLLETR